ncbi:MAG: GNAT family N-acetyltransferase, partial [Sedimentisphaerales bacterium]|nr:GNAT family N-acetyltransferase [Sedimentisphaerales bacterium]
VALQIKIYKGKKMIRIRTMTITDLPLGLKLKSQAGWNQTEADWLRFLALEAQGCFVAELDGVSVGTLTTCLLGGVAWIAMVLVDAKARRKGVGSNLLQYAIDYLDDRKVSTIRLDATPAGRVVYEKSGFIPEYNVARYEGVAPRGCDGASVEEVGSGEFDGIDTAAKSPKNIAKTAPALQNRGVKELLTLASIVEFDKRLTGTDRGKMLNRLFQEHPHNFRLITNDGELEGYITFRPGSNAFQIGPCVAVSAAGSALFSYAWSRCAGEPIFIDIPVDNADAVKLAESGGLKVQRLFTRMYRGEKVPDSVQSIWASSGPEKG